MSLAKEIFIPPEKIETEYFTIRKPSSLEEWRGFIDAGGINLKNEADFRFARTSIFADYLILDQEGGFVGQVELKPRSLEQTVGEFSIYLLHNSKNSGMGTKVTQALTSHLFLPAIGKYTNVASGDESNPEIVEVPSPLPFKGIFIHVDSLFNYPSLSCVIKVGARIDKVVSGGVFCNIGLNSTSDGYTEEHVRKLVQKFYSLCLTKPEYQGKNIEFEKIVRYSHPMLKEAFEVYKKDIIDLVKYSPTPHRVINLLSYFTDNPLEKEFLQANFDSTFFERAKQSIAEDDSIPDRAKSRYSRDFQYIATLLEPEDVVTMETTHNGPTVEDLVLTGVAAEHTA